MSETCAAERCFCCGRGHFCEPPHYPTELGQTWTCPDCGLAHEAFNPSDMYDRLPEGVRKSLTGALGWIGRAKTTEREERA